MSEAQPCQDRWALNLHPPLLLLTLSSCCFAKSSKGSDCLIHLSIPQNLAQSRSQPCMLMSNTSCRHQQAKLTHTKSDQGEQDRGTLHHSFYATADRWVEWSRKSFKDGWVPGCLLGSHTFQEEPTQGWPQSLPPPTSLPSFPSFLGVVSTLSTWFCPGTLLEQKHRLLSTTPGPSPGKNRGNVPSPSVRNPNTWRAWGISPILC